MTLTADDIQVGHLYRGKRRRVNPFTDATDDRVVLWISNDRTQVQYDSYFVKHGSRYHTVDMDKFLRWTKEEVPFDDDES